MAAFDLASYDVTSHVADPKGNNLIIIITIIIIMIIIIIIIIFMEEAPVTMRGFQGGSPDVFWMYYLPGDQKSPV